MGGPLAGVRVIEFGGLLAGPYAASVLAQFGAEVIKVESPGEGDPLRKWRKLHDGTSVWWYSLSRNKKSITLNLKAAKGQQIARPRAHGPPRRREASGVLEGGVGCDDLSKGTRFVGTDSATDRRPYKDGRLAAIANRWAACCT